MARRKISGIAGQILTFGVLLGAPFFLCAQSDSVSREVVLKEITVNNLGIPTPAFDHPSSVFSIDSIQLIRTDQTLIANSLNRIPGIMMQSGTLTTNRIIMRGVGARTPFGTNKIRAYLNEIPLTDGRGETIIEDLDLSFLGNVEVQVGPNASLYGAGLGGTLLFAPRKVEGIEGSATVGSFGTRKLGAMGGHASDRQQFTVGYQNLSWSGYRANNQTDRHAWMGLAKRSFGKASVSLIGVVLNQKAYIPSSIGETVFQSDPKAAAQNWFESAGYEHYYKGLTGFSLNQPLSLAIDWQVSGSLFWRKNYEPRPFNILKEDHVGTSARSSLLLRKNWGEVQIGFEWFDDRLAFGTFENNYDIAIARTSKKGNRLSESLESRTYLNTFFQSRYFLTRTTTLEAGLNRNVTYQSFEDVFLGSQRVLKKYDVVYSPRLGVVQAIHPTINLYGNISHGFSPPSVEESLNEDQTFNETIQAERGWNYEIGLKGNHERVTYQLSVYSLQVSDLLVTRRTEEDITFGLNAGKTVHNGTEAQIQYFIVKSKDQTLKAISGWAFYNYRFQDFENDGERFDGYDLTGVPRHQGSFVIEWTDKNWFASGEAFFLGRMPITDNNSVYNAPYQLMNAHLGRQFKVMGKARLSCLIRVNNLFNERYASMVVVNARAFGNAEPRYYYPGLPRNFQVTLRLHTNR